MALNSYRGEFVLVGGWAPYFLIKDYFDHCGSIDIDLVLQPSILPRYENIRDIVENLGYAVTRNPFRFEKEMHTMDKSGTFPLHLDLLSEPEPALRQGFLVEVQEDLRACLIPGISVVFDHFFEYELEAVLPYGGDTVFPIDVADIFGVLTTKGNALARLKDKDSYDIYSVSGFCLGSPQKAAGLYNELIGDDKNNSTVLRALRNIRGGFSSPTRYGCVSAARFIGSNGATRNDVNLRVTTFIDALELSL